VLLVAVKTPRSSQVSLSGCIVQISWSKDGQPIKSSGQYQVEMAGDRGQYWSRLTVYDVRVTDAGQWTVTAVNGFGTVTSSSALTVRRKARLR